MLNKNTDLSSTDLDGKKDTISADIMDSTV